MNIEVRRDQGDDVMIIKYQNHECWFKCDYITKTDERKFIAILNDFHRDIKNDTILQFREQIGNRLYKNYNHADNKINNIINGMPDNFYHFL